MVTIYIRTFVENKKDENDENKNTDLKHRRKKRTTTTK